MRLIKAGARLDSLRPEILVAVYTIRRVRSRRPIQVK